MNFKLRYLDITFESLIKCVVFHIPWSKVPLAPYDRQQYADPEIITASSWMCNGVYYKDTLLSESTELDAGGFCYNIQILSLFSCQMAYATSFSATY